MTVFRLAGSALVLGVLTGCTGGVSPQQTQAGAAVPYQVPDDTVAVTDPPRPAGTDVVLTFAAWDESSAAVEAAGYVSPVVESGGECLLELELDTRRVTVVAPAEPDATTTVCAQLRVPRDDLAAGVWTAVLHYRSPVTEGSSERITVEVPR